MKLFCVYSSQFTLLYSHFFEPSLRLVDPGLEMNSEVFEIAGNGDFRSAEFNHALIYKWKRMLEILAGNPEEILVFTDVDMIFNKPLSSAIAACIVNSDIVVTPEALPSSGRDDMNVGVLAMRSNRETRQLVSCVLDEMILRNRWDQLAFNVLVRKSNLQYKRLPYTFANGKIPFDENSVLFHATCTAPTKERSSLELKIEALSKAELFFANCRQFDMVS